MTNAILADGPASGVQQCTRFKDILMELGQRGVMPAFHHRREQLAGPARISQHDLRDGGAIDRQAQGTPHIRVLEGRMIGVDLQQHRARRRGRRQGHARRLGETLTTGGVQPVGEVGISALGDQCPALGATDRLIARLAHLGLLAPVVLEGGDFEAQGRRHAQHAIRAGTNDLLGSA